jgi:hypothetical protein
MGKFLPRDIVNIGDKIRVYMYSSDTIGKVHILAEVQSDLFALIDLDSGNRLVDPFPCKYGMRSVFKELYGSFSMDDLGEAVARGCVGESHYRFELVRGFCADGVFEKLAGLWNIAEGFKGGEPCSNWGVVLWKESLV